MEGGRFVATLISLLGIDPDDFIWQDLALCENVADADPDDPITPASFYERYESDPEVAAQVDEMCLSCPVMAACARAGQENGEYGVWGAIYWNGSGKPDKARNAHKTDETWAEIYRRIAS